MYLADHPEVFDIFLVTVGTIISPSSPISVHVGGHVSFAVTSNHINALKTRWHSEDRSIVEIDSMTGRAVALKEGKTNILFSDTIQYTSRIGVYKVEKLISDGPLPTISNVVSYPHYKTEYDISFRVYSNDHEIKQLMSETAPINNNLEFVCTATPKGWVKVNSIIRREGDRQIPTCLISPELNYPQNQVSSLLKL